MERLYVERRGGLTALLEYARTGKARCPWQFATICGIPWGEEVICGSGDKFYHGRKVDGLKIVRLPSGDERLTWQERPRPDFSELRETLGLRPQAKAS